MTTQPPVQILAVDDIEENLWALAALLDRPHLRVLTARSGNEALEVLLKEDVALALLDVQMPEMSGFELAELMRGTTRTRHVPIIFVTAGAYDRGRVFRGYEAGAVDFLYKPVDAHLLRSKVDVFVELHQQRRQLDEQVALHREMLRMSDMFVAVLGHDLRNPLQAIGTGAEILLRDPNIQGAERIARQIRSASGRMQRLVSQLLDAATARLSGNIPVCPEPASLEQLCRSVVTELEPDGNGRVSLEVVGDSSGTWDPDRLSQVLSNLVGNALEHGERAQPVRVRVDGRAVDRVTVEIANRGVIAADSLEAIFDPFARPQSKGSGYGLGLYIAQQIARAHGGYIEVSSSVDAGTVFSVVLARRP